ncbi:hypothetical protein LCGC14_2673480 [marine sediment metagenome]|uniref:Uncharacterized protein n=1 Tax=marine sediment metagenome TaxID=412755 RepID=A0A0F9CFF4_9ZZZZ
MAEVNILWPVNDDTRILFIYSNDPKKQTLKRVPLLVILVFVYFCHSCEKEGACTDIDLISRLKAGFYVRDSIEDRDTVLNNVTFYGELRSDSLIYDAALGLQGLEFPLPHSTEEYTGYVLEIDTMVDIINIWHTPKITLFSYACGFTTTHDIYWLSHTNTIIDSIAIVRPHVNFNSEENFKIYIKPAAADTAQ